MSRSNLERLTSEEAGRVCAFLDQQIVTFRQQYGEDEWWESYHSWRYGGRGWNRMSLGGTYICRAIAWYQWLHRKGSKEWRPTIIIRALLEESKGAT